MPSHKSCKVTQIEQKRKQIQHPNLGTSCWIPEVMAKSVTWVWHVLLSERRTLRCLLLHLCSMDFSRFFEAAWFTLPAWLSVCHEAGTPDYMAPEMIDPPHYHDNSADWWSLGVLMFVLRPQRSFSIRSGVCK